MIVAVALNGRQQRKLGLKIFKLCFLVVLSVIPFCDGLVSSTFNVGRTCSPTLHLAKNSLFDTLCSCFQGDFDNFDQVLTDRQQSLTPRQGGGHEHFHVTIIPVPIEPIPDELFPITKDHRTCFCVIASYYFDGLPDRIFRLRFYIIFKHCDNVMMKLFSFDKELEQILRKESSKSPEGWLDLVTSHIKMKSINAFQEFERCDILWKEDPDPTRQSYLQENIIPDDTSDAIHAIMMYDHDDGGVLLESQMMPGTFIRIQDELSLWKNELWVNDRGYDAKTKAMVYGNWNGVPYKLKRVASFQNSEGHLMREVFDPSLKWTLGPDYRLRDEYEQKMKSIGGISTVMNRKS
jgi:hypothetical protein